MQARQGTNRRNLRWTCSCRATVLLRSQRWGVIAHTAGMLYWIDTGSLRRACQESTCHVIWLQWECMEICLGVDQEPAQSLQVKVKGHTNMTDIVVRICHSPPDKGEVAEAFFRHLEEASHLHVLVLLVSSTP